MGVTPNYGLPYPEEADDADVPVDMSELAAALDNVIIGKTAYDAKGDILAGSAADSFVKVPVGADGRVLTADAASPGGIAWMAGPGGTYVPVALVDAKGDLLAGSAPDTIARLPVGADGQVLIADAAQALGLKWAAPSGIQPSIVDAKGDIIAATGPDTVARLAPSTDGQVLTLDSTQATGLKWGPPAAGGGGIPATIFDAKGDILAASANDVAARLGVGSDGQVLTADTAQALGMKWATPAAGGGGGLVGVRIFTASGTYTPTAGTTKIFVEAVGGGGAGGGMPATSANGGAGAGGGGGAYAASLLTSGFAGAAFTIGAGGTPGAGANGGNGGDTIFGSSVLVAKGGLGGAVGILGTGGNPGGAGGAAASSVGQDRADGGFGGGGSRHQTDFSSLGSGGSRFGAGHSGQNATAGAVAGKVGALYGAGGTGVALSVQTLAAQPGGAGAPGLIRIWEYA